MDDNGVGYLATVHVEPTGDTRAGEIYTTLTSNYDTTYKGIAWKWIPYFKASKVQSLKFKTIIYKTKDLKGKSLVGQAKVDFLESKYKEKHKVKKYNLLESYQILIAGKAIKLGI